MKCSICNFWESPDEEDEANAVPVVEQEQKAAEDALALQAKEEQKAKEKEEQDRLLLDNAEANAVPVAEQEQEQKPTISVNDIVVLHETIHNNAIHSVILNIPGRNGDLFEAANQPPLIIGGF